MPFNLCFPAPASLPQKPANISLMIKIANLLSLNFNALRVDLYNVNNAIFVGELTFTHGGGVEKFTPNIWDKKFAESWQVKA